MPVQGQRAEAASTAVPACFRHEALFYAGERDFVERIASFVATGVARGEPTLVVVAAEKIHALRRALDGDAERVQFLDMAQVGINPACIIPAWRRFVDEHGASGRPLRGVGEPVWPGRSAEALVECHGHEALLNLAFDGGPPWWLLCPYDTSSLPSDVIDEAGRTHPHLTEGGVHRASPGYPGAPTELPFADAPLLEPAFAGRELEFGAAELQDVRALAAWAAAESRLDAERAMDLALAVSELANNSILHGGGRGHLRVWFEGEGAVVCEVRDHGRIADPLAGRRVPAPVRPSGRGLWLANNLCDLMQIRLQDDGCVVRIRVCNR